MKKDNQLRFLLFYLMITAIGIMAFKYVGKVSGSNQEKKDIPYKSMSIIEYKNGEESNEFDRNELIIRVLAYNLNNQTDVSVDDLIDSYNRCKKNPEENSNELFYSYNAWFYSNEDVLKYYKDAVTFVAIKSGYYSVSFLNEKKLIEFIKIVDQAIEQSGQKSLTKDNYSNVCDIIEATVKE